MASQWANISTKNKANMLGVAKKTIKSISKDVVVHAPVDTSLFKSTLYAALNTPYLSITVDSGHGITEIANKLKIGDVYYFTSNQPYALRLEFGWSNQAPNGMFRLAIAKFPFTVNKITTTFINRPVIPL